MRRIEASFISEKTGNFERMSSVRRKLLPVSIADSGKIACAEMGIFADFLATHIFFLKESNGVR